MSACYEAWATGVAGDSPITALIDELPAAKLQPNLVFTSARYRGAVPGGYLEFAEWLAAHWAEVSATCLTHATQTNEPGRCAALLPVLGALSGPLGLIEVGASAGLCLHPDRYKYRYTDSDSDADADTDSDAAGGPVELMLGPADGRSSVILDRTLTGDVPLPRVFPRIAWRPASTSTPSTWRIRKT